MTEPAGPPRQRLFFALWPDAATRSALARVARAVARGNGRPVAADNLHLTLAFIGPVDAEQRDCLRRAAAGVGGSAFRLRLDQYGYWQRPRIAWLGAGEVPEALSSLVRRLNEALATECGHQPDPRPFAVHVTLARKARRRRVPEEVVPIDWAVDRFCLVESRSTDNGVRYELLECWPLAGDA
ncbi:RNA 2',3'-cyclic phosphodiesterase [Thiohalobacter sp. IOR34]|uniref:RNA 2',3'-cyclic phosphodiesterase n=1 Tax=Thiohalobacter sp. IOR34 TaxID=3057176 RepID=UPI0025B0A299|nr:RNA 2',3'-cyclic phosphodiesterase [Thiohalobacter sp. IOR34]WJW74737.1 RNA 2',3'-cyclic phosphodiesterase [Thiohalobacter sp. IOR34]